MINFLVEYMHCYFFFKVTDPCSDSILSVHFYIVSIGEGGGGCLDALALVVNGQISDTFNCISYILILFNRAN